MILAGILTLLNKIQWGKLSKIKPVFFFKIGIHAWVLFIIAFIIIYLIIYLIVKFPKTKTLEKPKPKYVNEYTEDIIKDLVRRWNYRVDSRGNHVVFRVNSFCKKCDCQISISRLAGHYYRCPGCGSTYPYDSTEEGFRSIIHRNIREKYPKELQGID